jgi:hypothetical protein
MVNPKSCGAINAELARAKTRRKAKRKPVVVNADAKRREFSLSRYFATIHGKGNWDMTDWRIEPETESGH